MSQADKYAELAITADRYNPAGRLAPTHHKEFVCLMWSNVGDA